ncbi:MAG TPA: uracil-DNA glycosylase [Chromatiales bacterium]|nr:uracil-DNA glycosylase [Chromatiales bacterium]
MSSRSSFDPHCKRCHRLAEFLTEVKAEHPDYHCAPVAPFGDAKAPLLIVGLAPGKHGANASGRPFTGDFAGILLYETLHQFGFASIPESRSADDDLKLKNCRITNAVKCLPPGNKPTTEEIRSCNVFLKAEIDASCQSGPLLIVALGAIAHNAVLSALGKVRSRYPFGHGHEHRLETGITLLDSYHCSRYNTQTRRLTQEMFHAVFQRARHWLETV